MTQDIPDQNDTVWPSPRFQFQVKWDESVMFFQEISGLDVDPTPVEYRHGDDPLFSVIKMPGIKKYSDITMKKGVFRSDNKFWDWFNQIKMNTMKRLPVTISLLDEAGNPTMVWTLKNAWPTKVSGTDLKAEGNEVAVEYVEIAHEGVTITSP